MIKLLIVEDESAMRQLLAQVLTEEGRYEIVEADCGARGLEIIKTQAPRIVILDIKMPDMSGMDVLKKIRQLDETIRVIIITILTDMSFEVGAERLGAYDFFRKPFDIQAFKNAVAEAADSLS
ncbi:MAG: response regulator [Candidatus Omnitrophica bacterium]|nr:response regulator [Candidatus Omnitrophota bacterium]